MPFNKSLWALLLCGRVAVAAVYTVCPGGFPWGSCNYMSPQAAFDAPASGGVPCGNEIQLAPIYWDGNYTIPRSCAGNPMLVTSMRKAWLPASDARITPAHRTPIAGVAGSTGNVPTIRAVTYGYALRCDVSTLTPCSGWHFDGVAFTFNHGSRAQGSPGLIALGDDYAPEAALMPDDVSFDHSLVLGTPNNHATAVVGMEVLGTNITVKNSYFSDMWKGDQEAEGINGNNVIGPETYTNNFFATAGIPIFHDGASSFYGRITNGATVRHNYFYKWPKWNNAFNNPEYRLFQSLGFQINSSPCVKNTGEMKNIINGLWQYNVHENAWATQYSCQTNNVGFTYTPRAQWVISNFVPFLGTLTVSDATHASWSGDNGPMGSLSSTAHAMQHYIAVLAAPASPGDTTLTFVSTGRFPPTSTCTPNCRLWIMNMNGIWSVVHYTAIVGNSVTGVPTSGAGSVSSMCGVATPVMDYEALFVGAWVCPQWSSDFSAEDVECRKIVAADYDNKTLTVEADATYGGFTQTGAAPRWMYIPSATQKNQNLRVENEVFRNTYMAVGVGMHHAGVLRDGAAIINSTFSNNLWQETKVDYASAPGYIFTGLTEPFVFDGSNNSLALTWSNYGGTADSQTITIAPGTYSALSLAVAINAQLRYGQASLYTYGGTTRMLISAGTLASGKYFVSSAGTASTYLNVQWYGSAAVLPVAIGFNVAESSTIGGINSGPFTMDHNAFFIPDAMVPGSTSRAAMIYTGGSATNTSLMDGFRFTSNVMNPSIYSFFLPDTLGKVLGHDTLANAVFANNSIPVGPAAQFSIGSCTGGRVCTGNILNQQTMDNHYLPGTFKVAPGSPFSKAGYDGQDLGPNPDHLALINNLTVVPGKASATFEYDLTPVNQDVPCVLEVSTSSNLIADVAPGQAANFTGTPYTVVNALNPTLFRQPDTDRRNNAKLLLPLQNGLHHTFVVGQPGSVADDNDGTARSLELAPGTQHFYRLMCGGDTVWGNFTTANENDSLNNTTVTRVSIKMQAPTGTTIARVSYGATRSLGTMIDGSLDGSGNVEFLIPVIPGVTTYYQISFIGATTTVLPIAIL